MNASRWALLLSILCLILSTFCVIQWVREAKLREEVKQLRQSIAQPVK